MRFDALGWLCLGAVLTALGFKRPTLAAVLFAVAAYAALIKYPWTSP